MQEKRREPALMDCLSFRDIGGHSFISAARHDSASRPPEPPRRRYNEEEEEEEEGEDEGDFEFALVLTEETIAADDIFSDGRIRPLCPLDQEQIRRVLGKEPQRVSSTDSASASSEVDELEGVAPGTYCAWEPPSREEQAQGRCKKSSSTGNLRRWRIRDLVPRQSRSDGKERFMFLTVGRDKKAKKDASDRHSQSDCKAEKDGGEEENKREKKKKEKGGVKAGEWDMAAAHCVYYGKGGEGAARRGARRSFLPYKQNVVGFFGRTHPPG